MAYEKNLTMNTSRGPPIAVAWTQCCPKQTYVSVLADLITQTRQSKMIGE